ncbi:MAG: ABC transporter substrate-binding protein [Gammaproteobacteria bacterium]|nr:ABC transporter substrate-binding protein [Gammaproteobacteria bacterium]
MMQTLTKKMTRWPAWCLALTLMSPTWAYAGDASRLLRQSIDQVLSLLRDKNLDKADRREQLRAVIEKRFDFQVMSQFTLSVEWRKATPAEREAFVQRFTRMVEASYLGRLEQYTDQKVEVRDERERDDKAVVNTVIVTQNVDIPIDYKMRREDGDWRIYDVQIEGVSLVRNYRDSYRNIAKNEGMSGLLARMEKKIAELEAAEANGDKTAATSNNN